MELRDLLSIGAFIVSVASLTISIVNNRRSAITGIKPVLIFAYGEHGWVIQNIGNGPALNIVVAQKQVQGAWFNPVRIPPISKGTEFPLTWWKHVNDTGLGATYTDFQGRVYSSTCANDLSAIHDGNKVGIWKEIEISRHWKQ